MPYSVAVEHFEGPLDLLLQLVERNELEISKISLAKVADQFVAYMHAGESKVPPEELADFLVVASRLVYMKSKLLMPDFKDDELEEGPDLETQLREYQRFVAAARLLDEKWKAGCMSFIRPARPVKRREAAFSPPSNATVETLYDLMKRVIARIEPIIRLPKVSIRRAVSIREKIHSLFARIGSHAKISFHKFIREAEHREEAIVSFLALLELVKQHYVTVEQTALFLDISISAHPDAPEEQPYAESFI